jgi:L-lactate dehydrogenase complex protein LldE
MRVALFIPCFVDLLAPRIGLATARLLAGLGHEVVYPSDQTCCGQPALNAGRLADAACLADRLCQVFAAARPDVVVAPSGSCVAALRKEGPARLGLDHAVLGRLRELSEFLVEQDALDLGARFPARVTWHDGCHALRELGVRDGPRALLGAVRELELVETPAAEECCGFGGTFAVKAPEVSAGMGARKVDAVEATGADYVASTEPSCLLQLDGLLRRRHSRVRTIHLAEILAARGGMR